MASFVLACPCSWVTIESKGADDMSTSTIRLDDGVREETTRIASEMGLTFNADAFKSSDGFYI